MAGQEVYRIVYTSRATKIQDDVQIRNLAEQANVSNRRIGVTGLLLYDGNQFIQAIEGVRDAVIGLMNKIEVDPRHSSISYIHNGYTHKRQFGDWAMKCKHVLSGCCPDNFLRQIKADLHEVDDPYLNAAFIGFAVLGSHRPRNYDCQKSQVPNI